METDVVICGDALEVLRGMPDKSVDAIVTDPPYGLAFLGKDWDHSIPGVPFWQESLRVAKPGCHLLAFGGTRTFHRLTCAIEDAGWEIRDTIMWVYGSGFPKSHDVSKAIDKEAGAEREVVGKSPNWRPAKTRGGAGFDKLGRGEADINITVPATDAARKWAGWGTTLKPAWEPIIVARKPLEGTVAENVQKYGTGAMNVDGCKVGTSKRHPGKYHDGGKVGGGRTTEKFAGSDRSEFDENTGRWPANLIHDGSEEVLECFPFTGPSPQTYVRKAPGFSTGNCGIRHIGEPAGKESVNFGDSGSAARFFYCAKASRKERDAGLEEMPAVGTRPLGISQLDGQTNGSGEVMGPSKPGRNSHPCVKPVALMRYLCRLVTPPQGLVLDLFAGSGSTLCAAKAEGFHWIGIERDTGYCEMARKRIAEVPPSLFGGNEGGVVGKVPFGCPLVAAPVVSATPPCEKRREEADRETTAD